ncbi:MAG TPA: pseudouridine synthase [Euryarchaeota archaeon]|nr:pseudouridine synthase [Euryarchaeota archaeon]
MEDLWMDFEGGKNVAREPFLEDDSIDDNALGKEMVRCIAEFQFGKGAGDLFTTGELELVKSKNTGKLRNVFLDGRHILSLRASSGLFTLKISGAQLLVDHFAGIRMRVKVDSESALYNAQGKNVFPQFIIECDDKLRPGDEVIVVNEKDELAATGRMLLAPYEIPFFKGGVAVRVKEGLSRQ